MVVSTSFRSGHDWLFGSRDSGTGIDLVGVDVFFECFGNSLIEPDEQLGQRFSVAAHEHGQGVVLIAGYGDAADGVLVTHGDFAELD